MPKTIAITPSWYWPESVERVTGIPPYSLAELCLARHARNNPERIAIIDESGQVSYSQFQQQVTDMSMALLDKGVELASMDDSLSRENLITLMAVLSSSIRTHICNKDMNEPVNLVGEDLRGKTKSEKEPVEEAGGLRQSMQNVSEDADKHVDIRLNECAVIIPKADKWVEHSNRSLMASVISFLTFLQPDLDRAWLAAIPTSRWEGLLSILCPLYAGSTVILSNQEDNQSWLGAITDHQPGYALLDFDVAATATREAKKEVKRSREILNAILLSTNGLFDPGDRQRIGKSFRCPALTLFGTPETATIFAAHPLWYLDESVGIPVTNAHVVPSDPRSGTPIQTLWELVESAEVTIEGPSLCCGYEGEGNELELVNSRFRTKIIASSDANGMVYILPD